MENLAGLHHRLQPWTPLGRLLHGHKQRQQAALVGRSRVFAQCLTQRKMLCLSMGGEARRVSREKCERRVLVLAVFGKIEMDTAHQVPRRVTPLQTALTTAFS